MSVIDHMARCLVLVAIGDNSAVTIARILVERVFRYFHRSRNLAFGPRQRV